MKSILFRNGGKAIKYIVMVYSHPLLTQKLDCVTHKYTQSQKKRTMNSLASPVTQGQGQVTQAG